MSSPTTTSRPGSSALSDVSWATATSTPTSPTTNTAPRSLVDQIDHIKTLVTRLQTPTARQPEILTAQLFRNRRRSNSAREEGGAGHVLHVLDGLKRRVKQEQGLMRRASEVDPETDSDLESPERGDGEGVREEAEGSKKVREEWLEMAERRVDGLEDELEKERQDKEDVRNQMDELREEQEESETVLQEMRTQLDDLSAQKEASDKSSLDMQAQLSVLQQLKQEMDILHTKNQEKINDLGTSNASSARRIEELIAEQKQQEDAAQQRHKELQERYTTAQGKGSRSATKAQQLEEAAIKHETQRQELVAHLEEHKRLAANAKSDTELRTKDLEQLRQDHEKARAETEILMQDRDDLRERNDALSEEAKKHEISKSEAATAREERDELRQKSEALTTENKTLQEARAEANAVSKERDELRGRIDDHVAENEKRTKSMQEQQQALRREHEEQLSALTKDLEAAKGFEKDRDDVQSRLDALAAQKDEQASQSEKQRQELVASHEEKLQHLNGSLGDTKKQFDELQLSHDALIMEKGEQAKEAEKQRQELRNSYEEKLQSLTNDLQDARGVQKAYDELQARHEAMLARIDDEGKDAEGRLRDADMEHEHALKAAKEEHSRAIEATRLERDGLQAKHDSALAEKADEASKAERAIQELETGHADALKTMRDEHTKRTDDTKEERDELQARFDAALAEHRDESIKAGDTIRDLKADHDQALNAIREEHVAMVATAETQLDELQVKHDAVLADHRDEAKKAESSIESLKAAHENVLNSSNTEHSAKVAAVKKDIEDLQARYDLLCSEHDEKSKTSERRLQELSDEHQDAIKSLTDRHESERQHAQHDLDETKASHSRGIEDLRATHGEEAQKLRDAVAETERNRGETVSNLHTQLADLNSRAADLEKDNKSLHDQHSDKERELGDLRSRTADLEKDNKSLLDQYNDKSKEYDQLVQAAEERTKALERQRSSIEQLAAEAQAAVTKKEADIEEALSAKDSDLANVHSKLSDLQQQLLDQSSELALKNTELAEGARSHEQRVRELEAGWSSKADEAARLHQADKQSAADEATRARDHLEKQLNGREAAVESRLATAREDSAKALAKVRAELQSRLDDAQRTLKESQNKFEATRTQHESAMQDLRQDHEARVMEMQSSFDETHAESKRDLEAQLAAAESASSARSVDDEGSTAKHQAELASLRQTHEEHSDEMLRKLSAMEARLEKTGTDHAQTLSDKEELEYKISQLKSSHDQALSRLEQEHEASLAATFAKADKQLEDRLHEQSQAHESEFDRLQENLNSELQNLQIQLEEADELRHTQMQAADAERERALGELNSKVSATEETTAALQARLDAELTSRAETERSLAELRRQKMEEDKRAAESRDDLQQQIFALQVERDTLAKRTEDVSNLESESTATAQDSSEQVTVLRRRLAAAESERDQARESAKAGGPGGQSELARQNDFLASQLEAMIASRSTPVTPPAGRSDASAQTEPIAQLATPEDAAMLSSQQPKTSELAAATQRGLPPRPVTPENKEPSSVRSTEDRATKTRSFEDYLKQAQAELSELGSVITQNEALFAQKIQEHVGDLQRAKDQMAAEYKDKFDALLMERERMERDVSAKSAEEFVRERQRLVENYGAYHDEPAKQAEAITGLSSPNQKALRSAEERLVSEYNQKVVKRRSKIALKHAEDFQTLTQDYDRSLAELLGNRNKLESDLSVEPDRFEKDYGELEVMSAKLENEKPASNRPTSPSVEDAVAGAIAGAQTVKMQQPEKPLIVNVQKSGLPKRCLTSAPRTPTSIPRAGRPILTDFRPRQTGEVRGPATERLPHIRQQSLMSPRNPADELASRRIPSGVRGSQRLASQPVLRSTAEQDLSIEADEFEQRVTQQYERSPLSPDMPKSSNYTNKRRSLRHSSGIMYGNWQAQRDL